MWQTRPAQLPADLPDFTGREQLVTELRNCLVDAGRTVPVAAITGAGGLGKTALAVHVAGQVAEHFPDGQLFAQLRGTSAEPLAPSRVLSRFLGDLGINAQALPVDEATLVGLYRTLLSGRRVLIVLDDAADAGQVRPLLPGSPGCAVLVTTRNRLADLEAGRPRSLQALDDRESAELFHTIVGPERAAAEPAAVREILQVCGGLPLAIRIVAARLASRPTWTIAGLAARLADERHRLDEMSVGDLHVRASFEVSYTAFAIRNRVVVTTAASLFRLLGVWPGVDISVPAAAALLDCPVAEIAPALEELVDASLIESAGDDRYRFHDLLRLYAAERTRHEDPATTRRDALRRLLTWYLHTAAEAIAVIEPARRKARVDPAELRAMGIEKLTFADHDSALNWCETELDNIVTATKLASSDGFHEIAWRLPTIMWRFFQRRSHWTEWFETHRIALDSARRLGNRSAEGWLLNYLGSAHLQKHEAAEAETCLLQSLEIVREVGERHAEARTMTNLGAVALQRAHWDEAIDWLNQALAVCKEVGDLFAEAATRSVLGDALGQTGEIEDALAMLEASLDIRSRIGQKAGQADSLDLLGDLHRRIGRPHDALGYLKRALTLREETGDRHGQAISLSNLAQVQLALGAPRKAAANFHRAVAIQREIGHVPGEREILGKMAAIPPRAGKD
ncbi:ATP-binding protein [Herbihabitans rhizosphaerae]|uniref:ATP-binding protein n=1 Tax=Herbihabitans rhizosphaerae TaxID=1872711 RepID=UPI001F5E448B|nr:tetratricopeptide repeat protein [Herbihabitans rhizosphaerae]